MCEHPRLAPGAVLHVRPQDTPSHLPAATTCTCTLWLPDLGCDAAALEHTLLAAIEVTSFDEQ